MAFLKFITGPTYTDWEVFDLELMEPYGLSHLCDSLFKFKTETILYLPRTSDLRQLAKLGAKGDEKLKIVHYCVRGASKALCVFYGEFDTS